MAEIRIESVTKTFGDKAAVRDANLIIEDREFLVLLGPRGCGKTTLLRAIAGLDIQSSGRIYQGGAEISATCDTCHIIRAQGRENNGWFTDPNGLAFVHPADEEVMEEPILCHECHDGALGY